MKTLLTFGLSLFLVGLANAAVLHVPDAYPTIQAAIDDAANEDVIQIAPGTYTEDSITVLRNITIRGRLGSRPIIEGSGLAVFEVVGALVTIEHIHFVHTEAAITARNTDLDLSDVIFEKSAPGLVGATLDLWGSYVYGEGVRFLDPQGSDPACVRGNDSNGVLFVSGFLGCDPTPDAPGVEIISLRPSLALSRDTPVASSSWGSLKAAWR